MFVKDTLEKYCLKTTRNQRSLITSHWNLCLSNKSPLNSKICNILVFFVYDDLLLEFYQKMTNKLENMKNVLKDYGFSSKNNLFSAHLTFIVSIFFYFVNLDKINKEKLDLLLYNIDALISFIILYIVIDHTLDDDDTNLEEFKIAAFNVFANIKNKNINDPLVKIAIFHLENILKISPNSKPSLISIAKSEFKSIEIQKSDNNPLNTCYEKGGKTFIALSSILSNGDVFDGADTLGKISQLVDDILDVEDDKNMEICTYVTETLDKKGNIDCAIEKVYEQVSLLSKIYDKVKPSLLHSISTVLVNSPYITLEMRCLLLNYSVLLYTGSGKGNNIAMFDLLVNEVTK